MRTLRILQVLHGWSEHRRFVRRIKNDYRKAARLKIMAATQLPEEEDQLFVKVDREF
ncbi:MAG: hypothetical protein M0Z55_04875 [Peptococcaceae bacterium]|nr:hypothetical protein [Peptococcaceae bacterium]